MLSENKNGFTLLEAVVALGVFGLVITSVAYLITDGLRYNRIIWDQLQGQTDVRKVLQEVVDDARRAEQSSTGAYTIENAGEYDLRFYANIDNDGYREKVHFWIEGTDFKKGVIKPAGMPLAYSPANEQVVILARNVTNIPGNKPLFKYYNESYAGSGSSLAQPVEPTNVRVIRVYLEIDKDPGKSPVVVKGESVVEVRNLKTN